MFPYPHHQLFFWWWVFWDRISGTISLGWLWTVILLICASWVARITGAGQSQVFFSNNNNSTNTSAGTILNTSHISVAHLILKIIYGITSMITSSYRRRHLWAEKLIVLSKLPWLDGRQTAFKTRQMGSKQILSTIMFYCLEFLLSFGLHANGARQTITTYGALVL
jgi:hypothetical protein